MVPSVHSDFLGQSTCSDFWLRILYLLLSYQTFKTSSFILNLSWSPCFLFYWLIEASQDKVHKFPSHFHQPVSICIEICVFHSCYLTLSPLEVILVAVFSSLSFRLSNFPLLNLFQQHENACLHFKKNF